MLGLPAAGGGPVGEEPEPTTRALNVEIHRHGGHPKRRWVTRRRVTERSGLDVHYLDREHGDVRDTGADTACARQDFAFAPATSLEEGLVMQFEWLPAFCQATTSRDEDQDPRKASRVTGLSTT